MPQYSYPHNNVQPGYGYASTDQLAGLYFFYFFKILFQSMNTVCPANTQAMLIINCINSNMLLK